MGLDYNEFKQFVKNREFREFRSYMNMINFIEELDLLEKIKFFYPRNIFNDNEKEFIFFVEDGYFTVVQKDEKCILQQFLCKPTKKTLVTSDNPKRVQVMNLEFDNGNDITFHSTKDSNKDWEDDYSSTIRDLYKLI